MGPKKPLTGKSFSAPSSASSNLSMQQTKITSLLQQETAGEGPKELSVSQMFQEFMRGQNELKKEMTELKEELRDVKHHIAENKKKIVALEEGAAGLGEEIKIIRKGNADLENFLAKIEFERMSFFLRFQNLPETENEDLKDIMSTILADYIKRDKKQLWWDMDLVP